MRTQLGSEPLAKTEVGVGRRRVRRILFSLTNGAVIFGFNFGLKAYREAGSTLNAELDERVAVYRRLFNHVATSNIPGAAPGWPSWVSSTTETNLGRFVSLTLAPKTGFEVFRAEFDAVNHSGLPGARIYCGDSAWTDGAPTRDRLVEMFPVGTEVDPSRLAELRPSKLSVEYDPAKEIAVSWFTSPHFALKLRNGTVVEAAGR